MAVRVGIETVCLMWEGGVMRLARSGNRVRLWALTWREVSVLCGSQAVCIWPPLTGGPNEVYIQGMLLN